jgi:hypothetical protein
MRPLAVLALSLLILPSALEAQAPNGGISKVNPAQMPEAVVSRHVEAYNAKDLNTLLGTLDLDVRVYAFPDRLQIKGKTDFAKAMRDMFGDSPNLRMDVTERMVAGTRVIDHLWMKGRTDGKVIRALQIYEVRNGQIIGIWFAVD